MLECKQRRDVSMKLNYKSQLILTCALVLLGNILSTVLRHWIYRNVCIFICGLIWIFHPVMAGTREASKKELRLIQIFGGSILMLMAFFTRAYVY